MALVGQVLRVHEAISKGTDGRLGHNMIGVPTLLLRTTGRRSGAARTNSLVYARDGADYVVVASVGGADHNPGWLFNLRANPDVEIQIGRERQKVRVRGRRAGVWRAPRALSTRTRRVLRADARRSTARRRCDGGSGSDRLARARARDHVAVGADVAVPDSPPRVHGGARVSRDEFPCRRALNG